MHGLGFITQYESTRPMIIRTATKEDLHSYYGYVLPCDSMTAVVGVIDGKIKAVSGVCRWENKPTIAIADFDPDMFKRDIVRLGREAMRIIKSSGESSIWAVCDNPKSKAVLQRIGFDFVNRMHDRDVMVWEPKVFDFYGLVEQLNMPGGPFTQSRMIDLISYGIDTQCVSVLEDLEASAKRYFCNGVYIKELLVPAGTLMVGKVHKTEHLVVMTCGDVSVMTPDKIFRLTGHNVFNSSAGMKRVGYFHEDTMWMNVHASHGITNSDEMDDYLVEEADRSWIYNLYGSIQ